MLLCSDSRTHVSFLVRSVKSSLNLQVSQQLTPDPQRAVSLSLFLRSAVNMPTVALVWPAAPICPPKAFGAIGMTTG